MSNFEVIILSVIQALTEFLPVSSSGHLDIAANLLNIQGKNALFDVLVHLGTLLSIIVYFRKDIVQIFLNTLNAVKTKNLIDDLGIKLILASIPALIVGYVFKNKLLSDESSIVAISINLIIWGVVFIFIQSLIKSTKSGLAKIEIKNALLIGLFQILSLFKGTSRSGASIIGGLVQKFDLETSAKFAFLMSIPTIGALSFYEIINFSLLVESGIGLNHILIAVITSFICGLLAINLFMQLIKKFGLKIFGYYRIILGAILLIFM